MDANLVALNMCGAIALLLFGLSQIKAAVYQLFGAKLRHLLAASTRTGVRALVSGFGATIALQSSTATAILVASFAQRRMLSSRAGLIVMLGANMGTAVTAWIVSFHLSWISPLAIFVGYVLSRNKISSRSELGNVFFGIGLLLLALHLLDSASEPMRDSAALAEFLMLLEDVPIVALGFSALIAFLSTSSLAAVMMIGSIVASGQLGADLVIFLVLGANIGGALPPVLATINDAPHARRLALGNLFIRTMGAILVISFVKFAPITLGQSLSGLAKVPVNAHLIFNLIVGCLAWPCCGVIASLFKWLVPNLRSENQEEASHLADDALSNPVVALASATREVLKVGDLIERMLQKSLEAFQGNATDALENISELEARIDQIQQSVKAYVSRLSNSQLNAHERKRAVAILNYVINLGHIADIIEKGLTPLLERRCEESLTFSRDGYDELLMLFSLTLDNLEAAQAVFSTEDFDLARLMIETKVEVRRMEKSSEQSHLGRLRDGRRDSLETSSLHLNILRDLKRINAHFTSAAHPILEDFGVLTESRLIS